MGNARSFNGDESIDRLVGRRTAAPDGLSTATSCTANSVAWRNTLGGVRVPRGVYRFATHDEADQWLWRMITRPTRAATPAMPADALELLANTPSARQTQKALKARIRKQRADRHASDAARG